MAIPKRPPATFGRYRLIEPLGQGGMAVVYRAVALGPQGFERPVAIKRILPEYASEPSFIKMMASEAQLISRLQHPGIVQLLEFDEVDGECYLAMELVEGLDLARLLNACLEAGHAIPQGEACFIIGSLAAALGYAHGLADERGAPLGIVHRDVSPSNVLISSSGAVKLVDFGVAKVTSALAERTRTGVVKGKCSYMAPEQAEALPLDGRADLFALGIVLHELLTGRRLFKGETELRTLKLLLELQVVPPSQVVPGIEPQLDSLVLKMLARAPRDRPRSCLEVAVELQELAARHGGTEQSLAALISRLGLIQAPPAASATVSHGEAAAPLATPPAPIARRRRWPIAAGLLALVALGTAGGYLAADHPALAPPLAPALEPIARGPIVEPPALPVVEPAPPPAPSVPATVRLRVRGPKGARVLVDGKPLGPVPLDTTLPGAAGERKLTVTLRGMAPFERAVAADSDQAIDAKLTRKSAARTRRPAQPQPAEREEISNPFP